MKLLLGLIIVAAVALSISVIDKQNKQSQEKAAFEQLSMSYQHISIYPGAQNIWRGATQEELAGKTVVRISSFTTHDSKSHVMDFYQSTLEGSGWRYDDDGYGGHVTLTCSSFLEGDFYVNSQNEHVWIAEYYSGSTNNEYRIYKVAGSFWMYGDCF